MLLLCTCSCHCWWMWGGMHCMPWRPGCASAPAFDGGCGWACAPCPGVQGCAPAPAFDGGCAWTAASPGLHRCTTPATCWTLNPAGGRGAGATCCTRACQCWAHAVNMQMCALAITSGALAVQLTQSCTPTVPLPLHPPPDRYKQADSTWHDIGTPHRHKQGRTPPCRWTCLTPLWGGLWPQP